VLANEPVRQVRPILALQRWWQGEEVAHHFATTPGGATVARPATSARDIDLVVNRDLAAAPNGASGYQLAAGCAMPHPRIRIATVVHMAIRIVEKHHLPIGIIAVVGSLAVLRPEWSVRRHLSHNVDRANALACGKGAQREQAETLDGRRPRLDIRPGVRSQSRGMWLMTYSRYSTGTERIAPAMAGPHDETRT
jgi:hypothetical protein